MIDKLPSPGLDTSTLLDQLEYSVLITDRDGRIEYVNAAFERSSGYSCAEVIGKTPRILSESTMPSDVYDDIWRRLETGQPRHSTFPNRKKTGEFYREDTSISLVRNANGEITHYVWIAQPAERKTTEELFTKLAESSPAGVYVSRNDKFFFANQEFLRYTGYQRDELYRTNSLALIHPDDREMVLSRRNAGESQTYEYRLVEKTGRVRWVLEKMSPVDFLSLGTDQNQYMAGTIVDISDRKEAEEKLQYALSLYAATVESTADGIIVVDTERRIRQVNRNFRDIWGLSMGAEYEGRSSDVSFTHMLTKVKDPEGFTQWSREAFHSQSTSATNIVEMADGRVLEANSRPQVIDGTIVGRVWSFRDITERREFESALLQMANYDALTGLLNRRRFQEEVEEAMETLQASGGGGALLVVDADRFKDVNDSFGHQAGDEVLAQLAAQLKSSFPKRLVSRFGGEEFAIFLPDASIRSARAAASRFISKLNRHTMTAADNQLRVTVSIGIAAFPGHGETFRELFSHADLALYDAKFAGRNRASVYSGRDRPQADQVRENWRDKFHDALRNKRLMLVGQPVITMDGDLRGYELLLRLRSADGTLLPAKDFIPIAEQMGLLKRIDEWVVIEALTLLKRVQEQGHTWRLGLNLGGWAFGDQKMLDFLEGAFANLDVDPSGLVVEMTETAAVSDLGKARTFIEALQALGCSFALDDFGVGYASFDYLKRLPVNIIKIDGSFIRDLRSSKVSQEIVAAIVNAARNLGVVTVAESVENKETFDLVGKMGVNNVQGHWIGRPRPIAQILNGISPERAHRAA